MKQPLLSIIIPTKNRHVKLIETVNSILKFLDDKKLEIIIQDNSDDNKYLINRINFENHENVKYYYDNSVKDSVANFNDAIKNATGEYFTVIGDDDFVNPYIIDAVIKLKESKIDVLIYPRGVYYWPDVKFEKSYMFFESSTLQFYNSNKFFFEEKNSQSELKKILKNGGIDIGGGPCLYHGIAKKQVLDRIYNKFGSYILGYSPDISSTITLLLEKDTFHYTQTCLTIPGASFNSAAGMGRRGAHSTTLDELPDIVPKKMLEDWDENLPRIWNGFTFNAISIYSVLNWYKKKYKLDYNKHYTRIISDNIYNYKYIKCINSFKELKITTKIEIISIGFLMYSIKIIFGYLPKVIKNILITLHPFYSKKKYYTNVKNIDQAMIILKNYFHFILDK